MRHRKSGLKLNRTSSHRAAMFRNMATSFFKHERIRTTDAKAKELRKLVERLITLAKRGDLHARRQALSILREKAVAHKLFDEIGARFKDIPGGYTRIIKLGKRKGDAASLSLIELVDEKNRRKKKKRKAPAQPAKPEAPAQAAPEKVEEAPAPDSPEDSLDASGSDESAGADAPDGEKEKDAVSEPEKDPAGTQS
ncbi:50S ribosomal protein L17 [Candidatus Desulfarcum epimagneticum]|uniref:Large ribosomal subunit protein bL17 n=1 Tax=uncultured Desulfobacteraceae bacterium TaxID=218296 RepID=A0A484HKM8_9BACT|nr:50S ribosomal protein L17 [uncultured Desulfobacteraceae bacterium]